MKTGVCVYSSEKETLAGQYTELTYGFLVFDLYDWDKFPLIIIIILRFVLHVLVKARVSAPILLTVAVVIPHVLD